MNYAILNVNVRRRPGDDFLSATGVPARINDSLAGYTFPAGTSFTAPEGSRFLFCCRDSTLCAIDLSSGLLSTLADDLDGTPSAVTPVSGGVIATFADRRPRLFSFDAGSWTERAVTTDRSLTVRRHAMSLVTVQIPAIRLTDSVYSRTTLQFGASDLAAIGKALAEAFRTAVAEAGAKGLAVSPVVALAEARSSDGMLLRASMPVLVTPTDSYTLPHADFTYDESTHSLGATQLQLQAFSIALAECGTPSASDTSSCSLRVSRQLHPFDPASKCTFERLWLDSDTGGSSDRRYRFYIPGASTGIIRDALLACVADTDHTLHSADGAIPPLDIELSAMRSLLKAFRSLHPDPGGIPADLLAPHTFGAAIASSNGPDILYGSLSAIPFKGWNLHEMAVSSEDGTFADTPTAVCVTLADGSQTVTHVTLSSIRLATFSPFIAYPSPRARRVELISATSRLTLPLTPSPCGRMAYWLDPALTAVTIPQTGQPFRLPADTPSILRFPGLAALASASRPLSIEASVHVADGEIRALAPAPPADTTLGFSSAGFYALGLSGTSLVKVAEARRTLSAIPVDTRPVDGHNAVAVAPGAVYAVSGTDIFRLAGRKATTVITGLHARILGYNAPFHELWAVRHPVIGEAQLTTDTYVIPCAESSASRTPPVPYMRSGLTPSHLFTTPGGLCLLDGDILRDAADERDATVRLTVWLPLRPPKKPGWTRVTLPVPVYSRTSNGSATLLCSPGNPVESPDDMRVAATVDLSGRLHHPLRLPLMLPHCHRLLLRITLSTINPSQFALPLP